MYRPCLSTCIHSLIGSVLIIIYNYILGYTFNYRSWYLKQLTHVKQNKWLIHAKHVWAREGGREGRREEGTVAMQECIEYVNNIIVQWCIYTMYYCNICCCTISHSWSVAGLWLNTIGTITSIIAIFRYYEYI